MRSTVFFLHALIFISNVEFCQNINSISASKNIELLNLATHNAGPERVIVGLSLFEKRNAKHKTQKISFDSKGMS